jgi:hypothetical protein
VIDDEATASGSPQRIRIRGGFDDLPRRRSGHDVVTGTIEAWMPGQNTEPACLVHLDDPVTAEGDIGGDRRTVTGEYVVLELRYAGQVWERSGVVHVELCAERPPPLPWAERSPGAWVAAQAVYELVD